VERTLAAWDLRYCSPFLDKALMRVAFTISDTFKIKKGREKYILRRALESLVPPEVLQVRKSPQRMASDLAFSNALDTMADTILSRERIERRGIFRHDEIAALKRTKSDRPYLFETGMRLWTAILTEIWAEQFLERNGVIGEGSAAAE
jgi:asparagine synthase (glutamine-hydrolysing)